MHTSPAVSSASFTQYSASARAAPGAARSPPNAAATVTRVTVSNTPPSRAQMCASDTTRRDSVLGVREALLRFMHESPIRANAPVYDRCVYIIPRTECVSMAEMDDIVCVEAQHVPLIDYAVQPQTLFKPDSRWVNQMRKQ